MCARYISDQNAVGMKFESGLYATASGALQWIGQIQEHSISESENIQTVRYLGTGTRNVDNYVDGPRDVTGTVTYYPQDWKMLAFTLGSNLDAGSPSPFTHTISETNNNVGNYATSGTQNPFVSFGIEDSKTAPGTGLNLIRTVNGATVNSIAISSSQGEIVSCSVDYIAQNVVYSSGAATALTETTTRPFLWSDCTLKLPGATVQNEMKSFEVNISNNLEAPHYINGSRVIGAPIPLNREHGLNFTADATSEQSKVLYDQYFKGGSDFNASLVIDVASAGAGSRDMTLTLSGCRINEADIPSPVDGVNEYTFTIGAKSASVVVSDLIELYNAW